MKIKLYTSLFVILIIAGGLWWGANTLGLTPHFTEEEAGFDESSDPLELAPNINP